MLCLGCGGEALLLPVAAPPGFRTSCTSCGLATETILQPGPAGQKILEDLVRRPAIRRRDLDAAVPRTVLWLPPGDRVRSSYRAVVVMIRERLAADDPAVTLEESPYPKSPDDPLAVLASLADFRILVAPGPEACEAALALVGPAFPERRTLVLGSCLSPETAGHLVHPRLEILQAREDEPGGLFDAVSAALASIGRGALWAGHTETGPGLDPLLRDRPLARLDKASEYLLAITAGAGSVPTDRLLEEAGARGLLEDRLRDLREAGAVEETAVGISVTDRGRRIMERLLPEETGPGLAAEEPLASLIARARERDEEALGRLLIAGGEEARRIAHFRLGDLLRLRQDSEDIAQSAMVEVLRGLDRFEYQGEKAWKGYLRMVVENKIRAKMDYHGAAKRDLRRDEPLEEGSRAPVPGRAGLPPGQETPSAVFLRREEYGRLEKALEEMPEVEREVIMLRVFEGLSHRTIARRLGRPSVNAVHKLYGRALARLAQILGRSR